MDYTSIARIHKRIFSTKENSPEREKAVAALSETDRAALYDYDMGARSGRIKPVKVDEQEENGSMTYEQFKKKMSGDYKGQLREISKFAQESPELYQQYRERYRKEESEQMQLHNRRLMENKHKNKPYSFK